MKLKLIIMATIIIIGLVLIPVLLNQAGKIYFTRERIYKANWEINIPAFIKEIDHYTSPHGFHGDGTCYTIFTVEQNLPPLIINSTSKPGEIETRNGIFQDDGSKDIEQFVQKIAVDLAVPESHMPPFNHFYYWRELVKHGNCTLVILYFPGTNRVYFAEELR